LLTLSAAGQVEYTRVRQLVGERLQPGSAVLDVGGATGAHARWLAEEGHRVTLVDPVAEQVAVARQVGTFTALVGDARRLEFSDASFDCVLLLGPLYHLQSVEDRLTALREATRVLRPGGWLFAAGISRLVAAIDSVLWGGFESLPGEALLRLLETGEDSPEIESPENGFPGGHFHTAAELASELAMAGLTEVEVVGLEGPAGYGLELVAPSQSVVAAGLVLAERGHEHPVAANLSGHLLAIARTA